MRKGTCYDIGQYCNPNWNSFLCQCACFLSSAKAKPDLNFCLISEEAGGRDSQIDEVESLEEVSKQTEFAPKRSVLP